MDYDAIDKKINDSCGPRRINNICMQEYSRNEIKYIRENIKSKIDHTNSSSTLINNMIMSIFVMISILISTASAFEINEVISILLGISIITLIIMFLVSLLAAVGMRKKRQIYLDTFKYYKRST